MKLRSEFPLTIGYEPTLRTAASFLAHVTGRAGRLCQKKKSGRFQEKKNSAARSAGKKCRLSVVHILVNLCVKVFEFALQSGHTVFSGFVFYIYSTPKETHRLYAFTVVKKVNWR